MADTQINILAGKAIDILAASLDYETTVDAIAPLFVPTLADRLVLVTFQGEDQNWEADVLRVDSASGNLARTRLAAEELPGDLTERINRTIRGAASAATGPAPRIDRPRVLPDTGEIAAASRRDNSMFRPLIARGRLVGVLGAVREGNRAPLTPPQITLVENLIGRVAIALDNARLNAQLSAIDRRQDNFLDALGHELRNPLAAMSNALQCLDLAGDDRNASRTARDILQRQVQVMHRVVDELLDLSRLARGRTELHNTKIDLGEIIESAVSTVRDEMVRCRHRFTVTLLPEMPPLVADPQRLRQILAHLLSNAVKYTEPDGQLWLTVSREPDAVVISLRDTGMGIPPELLSHVFELFAKGELANARNHAGLGIGLTLVRRLVELHGGTVTADSEGINRGSTFTVRLPLEQNASVSESVRASKTNRADSAPVRTVLVIDDDLDLAQTTATLLRRSGCEVATAHSAASAVAALAESWPDAALIDIGLPDKSGYELLAEIRRLTRSKPPLFVAITGYDRPEDVARIMASGFDAHLVKPVDIRTLRGLLRLSDSPSDRL